MKDKIKIFLELKAKELTYTGIFLAICSFIIGVIYWIFFPFVQLIADWYLIDYPYSYKEAPEHITRWGHTVRYNIDDLVGAWVIFIIMLVGLCFAGYLVYLWIKTNIKTAERIEKVRASGHKFEIRWCKYKDTEGG